MENMAIPVYAAVCGISVVLLALRVVYFRRKLKIGIGSGESKALSKAIRVHANFVEHVPLALILLTLYELTKGADYYLHGACVVLILSRLAHAYGLGSSAGVSAGRVYGAATTFFIILMTSLLLLLPV